MSEFRKILNEHGMGITTLSRLTDISRHALLGYDRGAVVSRAETRMRIELAMKIIVEENWVRPSINKHAVLEEGCHCIREAHLRDVLKFEKDFRERYFELLTEVDSRK